MKLAVEWRCLLNLSVYFGHAIDLLPPPHINAAVLLPISASAQYASIVLIPELHLHPGAGSSFPSKFLAANPEIPVLPEFNNLLVHRPDSLHYVWCSESFSPGTMKQTALNPQGSSAGAWVVKFGSSLSTTFVSTWRHTVP